MKVLIVSGINGIRAAISKELQRKLPAGVLQSVDLLCSREVDDISDAVEAAEVIVAEPPAFIKYAHKAKSLRWMQSTWAGIDALVRDCDKRDYICTKVSGKFGPQMAQYTLGWISYHERKFHLARQQQQSKTWDSIACHPRRPEDVCVGVMGAGDIGRSVAAAAKVMGYRTVGFKRNLSSSSSSMPEYDTMTNELPELLHASDYIVSVLPSTPLTRGLLTVGAFKHCVSSSSSSSSSGGDSDPHRPPPVFINVGRGDVTCEGALVGALEAGYLSHAVLDVFPQEPLPSSSPLWHHPQISITPHIAAVSQPADVAEVFADNLARYLEWRGGLDATTTASPPPLQFIVDWEVGY